MGHAELFHTFQTRAVQRGVDELERVDARAVADALVIDSLHKIIEAFFVNCHNAARGGGSVKICQPDIVKAINFFDSCQNFLSSLQRDLAAVRAVDLVAVVLSGVVAGRHADARAAAEVPHRPRKRRGRLKPGVHAGGNAVRGQHAGGLAGEQRTVMAAVVGDGYLFGQAGRIEVVRQPLRCLAHGVEVHPVRARADHAAQAAGAEFQIAVKAVRDGVAVARDGDELGFDGVVQIRLGKPAVIEIVCIVHGVSPLSSLGSCGQPQAAPPLYYLAFLPLLQVPNLCRHRRIFRSALPDTFYCLRFTFRQRRGAGIGKQAAVAVEPRALHPKASWSARAWPENHSEPASDPSPAPTR